MVDVKVTVRTSVSKLSINNTQMITHRIVTSMSSLIFICCKDESVSNTKSTLSVCCLFIYILQIHHYPKFLLNSSDSPVGDLRLDRSVEPISPGKTILL